MPKIVSVCLYRAINKINAANSASQSSIKTHVYHSTVPHLIATPSTRSIMHAAILALSIFAGLTAAVPQPQTTSVAVPSGIFTNASVSDAFPSKLKARGYDDKCTECPPEPPTCDRYKGCLYIECSDDCEDENCCECIGLEKEKPYVFQAARTSLTGSLVSLLRFGSLWLSTQSSSQR